MRNSSNVNGAAVAARKIRTVLIDHSAVARAALSRLLDEHPRIEIAGQTENGLAGFALAARLRPDLVIADFHVPGLTGPQLAELLRHNYPQMRSIVTSVGDDPGLEASSVRRGADAFIGKPRLPRELPHLLNRLFPDTDQAAF